MCNPKAFFCLLLAAFCSSTSSFATIYTVKKNGSGDFTRIQPAIDAATHGDEIIVSPGRYIENIQFLGKDIFLRSTEPNSETIVQTTIIDGSATRDSVVTFTGEEGTTCVLTGFTITNGKGRLRNSRRDGGGIYGATCLATIEHNFILSNSANDGDGGGLYRCDGMIQNNTICENSAGDDGGGLYACLGTIQNNTICENSARYNGGGLYRCDGTIQNNAIFDNSAGNYRWSGGGGLSYCDGTIQNNTIFNNSAYNGGGLYRCFGTVQYNTIYDNSADGYLGGGGGLSNCGDTIQYNTIFGNLAADFGGGLLNCSGTIQHNSIFQNIAEDRGGGLYRCDGTIQNNAIYENSAYNGGGLFGCNGTIQNNTIYKNSANYGGGFDLSEGTIQNNTIYKNTSIDDGGGLFRCTGAIQNCILWQNSPNETSYSGTPKYSCIYNWNGVGEGNIPFDPLFVDPDRGDFHLTINSPCIDGGVYIEDLNEDFEGDTRGYDGFFEPRWDGSDYDIGADEYTGSIFSSGQIPEKPQNLSPPNGVTVLSPPVILIGSPFSSPQNNMGDFHHASQWQIDDDVEFPSLFYDSLDFQNITSTTFMTPLNTQTVYYWRVRYINAFGIYSDWSNPTWFETRSKRFLHVPIEYPTIQNAIDAAFSGDEIVVSPGRYVENIFFLNKNIILRSLEPTSLSCVEGTIIDGSATSDSTVTFSGSETGSCILSGFTITNGTGRFGGYSWMHSLRYGGGIYGAECLATIEHNSIVSNTARYGGGLFGCYGSIQNNTIFQNSAIEGGGGLFGCAGTIQNNSIYQNSARLGGGLFGCNSQIQKNMIFQNFANHTESSSYGGGFYQCHGMIEKNLILENFATRDGGGLHNCYGTIQNNLIYSNSSNDDGGGLYICDGTIQNNTISGNTASDDGGGLSLCNGTIRNCILWKNLPNETSYAAIPQYSCIYNWNGIGEGNINLDPLFVDPANHDYRLRPDSPCIDAGGSVSLFLDFDGNPRPIDAVVEPRGHGSDFDIGAYEFALKASMIRDHFLGRLPYSANETINNIIDANQDGRIDVADIIYLLNSD